MTDFVGSTGTFTVDTFTAVVASGDTVAICSKKIPLREMYRIANRALTELGDVPSVDTSITSDNNKTEYAIPVALKRDDLISVEYQTVTTDANDNQYVPIYDYDIRPAGPGSTGLLILPQLVASRTIKLVYRGVHPTLTAGTAPISEYIHPSLATAAAVYHALQWLNRNAEGEDSYMLQSENKALADLETNKARHPVSFSQRRGKWFSVEGVHLIDNFRIPS